MDPVSALEVAYGSMARATADLDAAKMAAPSQCDGWDVKSVLNHAFGAGWMFTLVNQGRTLGEDSGDVVGDDAARACRELAAANVAAWKADGALEGDRTYPFGTFPAAGAVMVNVGEIAVHAWDVAKSTGQDAAIDPDVAALLWDFYNSLPLDGFREHGAFGPVVPVPDSAPVADRVLGLIGFRP
ncbi:MAG TPA: TIGR03086 family metal-binding protein [Mycobacteriales bacterium]|jgi:uncharacterized protein (TIGR03086 family)|nr:TIGR03086 family metal-binding protein [Mycobacteriales bacterium]